MKRILFVLFLLISFSITVKASVKEVRDTIPVVYNPWPGGQGFKYLSADSGLAIPIMDTFFKRGVHRRGLIVMRPQDSLFYGYSGKKWSVMGADVATLITLLNGKVDSVTVSGDSLFYWKLGVAYGYILPTGGWKTTGNVVADGMKFGSTNSHRVPFYAANTEYMVLDQRGDFGIHNANPDKILDVYATDQGILIPRMTTTQRDAIASPLEGEWLYNNTTHKFNYYNGSAWVVSGLDTWQETLINGSTLSQDNTITNTGHVLSFSNGDYSFNPTSYFKIHGLTGGSDTDSIMVWTAADNKVHVKDPTSIVTATPTLQQVFSKESNTALMTGNNEINNAGNDFKINSVKGFEVNTTVPGNYIYMASYGQVGSKSAVVQQDSARWISTVVSNLQSSYINQLATTMDIEAPTSIELSSANLNFNPSGGTIGIGTASPPAGSALAIVPVNTAQDGVIATTSTLTTGNLMKLTSTSTVINSGSLLNISSSGVNSTASKTVTGETISVTNTGTTSINNGLTITASGATTNNAINVLSGNVNLTPLTASQLVLTDASKNLVSSLILPNGTTATTQAANTNNTTVATTDYVATAVAAVPSGLTVGTTTIASGTGTRLLYETSGNVLGEISGATSNGTTLTLVAPILGTPASGTVTNLTGTASININGTVGATTPTTGAFTTLTASTSVTTPRVNITGTTPSTWGSYSGVFDGGTNAVVYGTAGDLHLTSNAVGLGSWTYYANGKAANQYIYNGEWHFRNAGTGTAGGAISWIDIMTVGYNGSTNVGIGTTTPASLLHIKAATPVFTVDNTSNVSKISFTHNGTEYSSLQSSYSSGETRFANSSGGYFFTWWPDGSELMHQSSNGRLLIGSSGDAAASSMLEVRSTTTGFLPPRWTNAQMAAVSSPATGLIGYNTDAGTAYAYNGTGYKSAGVVSNSYSSGAVVAQTTFTVTFGGTQPNSTYKVDVAPTGILSAALFYVTNKTTTTFDVVYLSGLTGTVTFDYAIFQ